MEPQNLSSYVTRVHFNLPKKNVTSFYCTIFACHKLALCLEMANIKTENNREINSSVDRSYPMKKENIWGKIRNFSETFSLPRSAFMLSLSFRNGN